MRQLGIIGVGRLGGALLKALSNRTENKVSFIDQDLALANQRRGEVSFANLESSLEDLAKKSRIIFIAVKPKDIESTLRELSAFLRPEHLLISVCAGISSERLRDWSGNRCEILRVMPNVACMVQKGILAVAKDSHLSGEKLKEVLDILSVMGSCYEIPENLFDSFTALCASGPAFVFKFFESIELAAGKMGFDESLSRRLSLSLLNSSSALGSGEEGAWRKLINQIATKGGCTEVGLQSLSADSIDKIVETCLLRTRDKSADLGQVDKKE